MRVEPGGVYLVELRLFNAEQLGPAWLVGAFASTYPGADVVSVDEHGVDYAVVRIRWRSAVAGEVTPGTTLSGLVEGLVVPGEAVPRATVIRVEATGIVMPSLEQAIPDELKLALAGAILVTTWYLVGKIKESHDGFEATGADAA